MKLVLLMPFLIMCILGVTYLAFPKTVRLITNRWYKLWGFSMDENHPLNSLFIFRVAGVIMILFSLYFLHSFSSVFSSATTTSSTGRDPGVQGDVSLD